MKLTKVIILNKHSDYSDFSSIAKIGEFIGYSFKAVEFLEKALIAFLGGVDFIKIEATNTTIKAKTESCVFEFEIEYYAASFIIRKATEKTRNFGN